MRNWLLGVGALLLLAACGTAAAADIANDANPDANQVSYWCPAGGVKYEPISDPFIVPAPPEGKVWTLLVLKGGSGEGSNVTFANPVVGQGYSHPTAGNSHAILCYDVPPTTTAPPPPPPPPPPTTTTTLPSPPPPPPPTTTTSTTVPSSTSTTTSSTTSTTTTTSTPTTTVPAPPITGPAVVVTVAPTPAPTPIAVTIPATL